MPKPTPTKVQSDAVLPDAVDVIVIGAGIAGVSAALELAEQGLRVTEKGAAGGGTVQPQLGLGAPDMQTKREGHCRLRSRRSMASGKTLAASSKVARL